MRELLGNRFGVKKDPFSERLLHIQDQKSTGTNGGAAGVGANNRVLTTVVTNEIPGASLATGTGQITLPPGNYYIDSSAPAFQTDRHRAYLYDVSASGSKLYGTPEISAAGNSVQTRSVITGRFSVTGERAFLIRTYAQTATSGQGLGVACSDGGTEIYTDVKIWLR